jgi:hypothetical protein
MTTQSAFEKFWSEHPGSPDMRSLALAAYNRGRADALGREKPREAVAKAVARDMGRRFAAKGVKS